MARLDLQPWVMTNSLGLNTPENEITLTCSIRTDLGLHCAAGAYSQFQLWQYFGDGVPRLAIAVPGDTSIEGFTANAELSVVYV
jgi:hypothetical protein